MIAAAATFRVLGFSELLASVSSARGKRPLPRFSRLLMTAPPLRSSAKDVPWRDGVRTGACYAHLFDLQAQGYR